MGNKEMQGIKEGVKRRKKNSQAWLLFLYRSTPNTQAVRTFETLEPFIPLLSTMFQKT
jgi:hypothetical protein